ncbi:hypothetical protein HYP71_gp007 [Arthrobacter phage KBurrousTX]|uniref:Uncharacterized protein n=1 Tax=Arthrobacter phage KBurrousTX TaxID=2315608 RepID=A0A386K876_9CAUD|nr:hypothetical protein HYP71_gp007 [Arthrobacter phage KBurrousTX]AYD81501.1 hypothetical protein KBurrousTX_7 [Arthrobacter phage KBurrousTX]
MPIKRGANGRFVANGGRVRSKGKSGGKAASGGAALAKRGVDHILARNAAAAKAKKPTRKQQRADAMKKAQSKMLAAANAKNKR